MTPDNRSRTSPASMSSVQWLILGLRAIMEAGIVVGLAYWGWQTGAGTIAKIGLAIVAPVVGFGFWGLVDFRQAGRAAEPLRLVQELAVTVLVAVALWSVGLPIAGLLLVLLSVVYHVLLYTTGGRLLKAAGPSGSGR
jgi:Protein of unknown function (DUF2568)